MFRRNKHIVMLISSFGFLILKGLPCRWIFSNTKVTNSSDFSVNVFENSWCSVHSSPSFNKHSSLKNVLYLTFSCLIRFLASFLRIKQLFWVTINRARFLYSFWSACSSLQHSFFEICISSQSHLLKLLVNYLESSLKDSNSLCNTRVTNVCSFHNWKQTMKWSDIVQLLIGVSIDFSKRSCQIG